MEPQDPPKVKHWFWRCCKNFLPTKTRLREKNINCDVNCYLCPFSIESPWHLFMQCRFALACWDKSGFRTKLDQVALRVDSFTDLCLSMIQDLDVVEAGRFAMIGWRIWRERNSVCWEGRASSPDKAVLDAAGFLVEWQMARAVNRPTLNSGVCGKWHKPESGSVKINVDAAQFTELHQCGAGMIIRDEKGGFIAARAIRYAGVFRVDEAEVIGIHEALSWIKELGFNSVELETDAKSVAEAIMEKSCDVTAFGDYVRACISLCEQFARCSVRYISRNANSTAHVIARASKDFPTPCIWDEPPPFVVGLLKEICVDCKY